MSSTIVVHGEWLKANFADGGRTVGGIEIDGTGDLLFRPSWPGERDNSADYHQSNRGKGVHCRPDLPLSQAISSLSKTPISKRPARLG